MLNATELEKNIVKSLHDAKAKDVIAIDVRGLTDITDIMIIAHGTSTRHVRALARRVEEATLEQNTQPSFSEGEVEGEWILLDYVDVIVHLMTQASREYYDLEHLWDQRLVPTNIETPKKVLGAQSG